MNKQTSDLKQDLLKLLDDPAIMKLVMSKINKDNRKAIKKVTVQDVTYCHTCILCGHRWETQKPATFIGSVIPNFEMKHESCNNCKVTLMALPKEMLVERMIERAKAYLCQGRVR